MSRRMWVAAVGGWLAVVIAGSALTWVAIDRAGRQVTGSPGASTTQPAVVGTVGTAPTGAPSARQSPAATRSAVPTTPAPTSAPAPTRTASPGSSGSNATTPKPAPPTGAGTETRTWTGAPGWVTVACTGSRATLRAASPNDGWSLERGDTSGDEIEVKFTSGGTDVQVKATCVGGVPRFGVESGGSDDG